MKNHYCFLLILLGFGSIWVGSLFHDWRRHFFGWLTLALIGSGAGIFCFISVRQSWREMIERTRR